MKGHLKSLCKKIGYEFNNIDLLHHAITHRSVSQKNNERLEYLGDALLGLIIAEALYNKFPKASEGDMSRVRSNLVKGVTLSEMAREFSLGDYLHLGVGELKSGGFERNSILTDAIEALMGAIYLDSDFATCKERILAWYQVRLDDPKLFEEIKDPKTLLQEYLQARHLPLPEYSIISITGEQHDQTFVVKCTVEGLPHQTQNTDSTRRNAEQKTAKEFLDWLEQDND